MKYKAMLILLFLVYRFFFATVPSNTRIKEDLLSLDVISEWNCVKDKEGIKLFERWVRISDNLKVRERKGEMTLSCNYSETVNYLSRSHTIKEWMKCVTKIETIAFESKGNELKHIVFHLPWPLDNRDVIAIHNVYNVDGNKTTIVINSSNDIREYPGMVRIKVYRATWNIEKLSNASTKITLTTFSNEPPLFPLWIQEPVIKREYFNNLLRLKTCLQSL